MTGRTRGTRLATVLVALASSATLIGCGGGQTTTPLPSSPGPAAPPSATAQAADKSAQSTARFALAAALVLMIDADPAEITPDALHSLEGSFDWTDGAATEPGVASYAFDGQTIAIAVLSETGTCFRILRPAHGDTVYSVGEPCDGRAVLKAA